MEELLKEKEEEEGKKEDLKFLDIKKMENFSYTQFYEMKNVWKREREREALYVCAHQAFRYSFSN